MPKQKDGPGFEQRLTELEKLVTEMEAGEQPLEELITSYEKGMKLAGELQKQLEAAKGRITELTVSKDGAAEETPISGI